MIWVVKIDVVYMNEIYKFFVGGVWIVVFFGFVESWVLIVIYLIDLVKLMLCMVSGYFVVLSDGGVIWVWCDIGIYIWVVMDIFVFVWVNEDYMFMLWIEYDFVLLYDLWIGEGIGVWIILVVYIFGIVIWMLYSKGIV